MHAATHNLLLFGNSVASFIRYSVKQKINKKGASIKVRVLPHRNILTEYSSPCWLELGRSNVPSPLLITLIFLTLLHAAAGNEISLQGSFSR